MYTKSSIETAIGKVMVFSKTFEGNGEDFSAIGDAEKWLKERNITVGSMQREAPMGLARDADYISKWFNLGKDVKNLDGAILGDSKRNGPVTVYLDKAPEA